MPIDPDKAKATEFAPITVHIEQGRLRLFAKAIGQTDPVYLDLDAAKTAGHPDLPVPPTFFFSLELESPNPFGYIGALGVDLRRVLHGEQSFTYHSPVHAGDTVVLQPKIVDAFEKKNGALQFLVKKTAVTRDGHLVCEATTTLVVQHPEAGK